MPCQSIRASGSDEPLAGYVGRMKIDVSKHFEVFYPQTTSVPPDDFMDFYSQRKGNSCGVRRDIRSSIILST